jgi:hypothetical protein
MNKISKISLKKLLGLAFLITFTSGKVVAQINFASPIKILLDGSTDQVSVGDFNRDHKNDIIVVNKNSFLIFLQNKNNFFPVDPIIYPIGFSPSTMTVGDVNNDGFDDVIVGFNDTVSVYYQNIKKYYFSHKNKQRPFFTKVNYGVKGIDIDAIKFGDANNDGQNDIAISFWKSNKIAVLFGNKSKKLELVSYYSMAEGYDHIDICKIGKDTKNSVFKVCGQGFGPIIQYKINKDKTLEVDPILVLTTTIDNFSGFCSANTYKKDERYIFASHANNTPRATIFVLRAMSLLQDTILKVYDIPQTMRSGDLNNDGLEEVVVIHGGWNTVSVISKETIQRFNIECPNNAGADSIILADVNNDKKLDIITANTYAGVSILINTTKK